MSNSGTEPRVAVIAVHGVADQQPGDSAEAIAALLLSRTDGEAQSKMCYEPFQSRTIYVPLAPARAGGVASDFFIAAREMAGKGSDEEELRAEDATKPGLNARMARKFSFQESQTGYRETLKQGADAGLAYMRSLLGSYQGQKGRQSYKTLRLEGKRCDSGGTVGPSVDVYELYWADLSQLGTGPLRVLSSLYQLVLHVSELGRRALEDGFSDFGSDKRWERLVKSQALAVRQLSVAIPLFNLVLLATILTAVLVRVSGGTVIAADGKVSAVADSAGLKWSAVAGASLLAVGLVYRFATKLRASLTLWWLIPIGSIFLGGGIGYYLAASTHHPNMVLLAEAWILAIFGLDVLMKKYDQFRPGALASGRLVIFLTVVLFAVTLGVAAGQDLHSREIEYAALWTLQILNVLLTFFWILVVVFAARASLQADAIVRSFENDLRKAEEQQRRAGQGGGGVAIDRARSRCARAIAAIRTSRLALGISAGSMLGILVIVWSGVTAWGVAHVHAFDCMETTIFPWLNGLGWILAEPATLARWLGHSTQCPGTTFGALSYFRAVLLMGVTSGLPVSLFLVTLCVLLLVWMAMPSARYEGNSPSKCTNAESQNAGLWLSRGLDATKVIARLWWAAVFVVMLVFGLGDFAERQGWDLGIFNWSKHLTLPILSSVGTMVAASAVAILYAFIRFAGSALDVVLDVDNYLRERPHEAPPRALIAERYASLLRYLAQDRGKTGRPYDSVIIVAHSLGALITCDLLRFFVFENRSRRGDPGLEAFGFGDKRSDDPPAIPIRLFTMGNPLRQLLNRFFPHQYRWVREEPDNALQTLAGSEIQKLSSTPSPATLGVRSWTNAYRSGDYVGRGLWLGEWYKRTKGGDKEGMYPQKITVYGRGRACEMCIGLGAHTHYWDETAPDIRDELDRLIVGSAKPAAAAGVTAKQPYPSGFGGVRA